MTDQPASNDELKARLAYCEGIHCPALSAGKCGEVLECGQTTSVTTDFECPMRPEIRARLEGVKA